LVKVITLQVTFFQLDNRLIVPKAMLNLAMEHLDEKDETKIILAYSDDSTQNYAIPLGNANHSKIIETATIFVSLLAVLVIIFSAVASKRKVKTE
jgi:hypothetical protein